VDVELGVLNFVVLFIVVLFLLESFLFLKEGASLPGENSATLFDILYGAFKMADCHVNVSLTGVSKQIVGNSQELMGTCSNVYPPTAWSCG
jgi:hypothetical protein